MLCTLFPCLPHGKKCSFPLHHSIVCHFLLVSMATLTFMRIFVQIETFWKFTLATLLHPFLKNWENWLGCLHLFPSSGQSFCVCSLCASVYMRMHLSSQRKKTSILHRNIYHKFWDSWPKTKQNKTKKCSLFFSQTGGEKSHWRWWTRTGWPVNLVETLLDLPVTHRHMYFETLL